MWTKLLLIFAGLTLGGPALSAEPVQNDLEGPGVRAEVPPEFRDQQWPQWRGPLASGTAPNARPPVTWSETENVRWKVDLPGQGHSTPVIWGEHLFLTLAVPVGDPFEPVRAEAPGAHDNAPVGRHYEFRVAAIDRSDGAMAWSRTVRTEIPWQGRHISGSFASPSPVTDGEVLIAPFGSQGIYGLSLDGEVLWERDFGVMQIKHAHGEGGSPALHGDSVVLAWDHEGPSFLVALDRKTGVDRWRVKREQGTSWSTPIVIEDDGRGLGKATVVVAGTDRLRGHDLATGRELWHVGGLSANVVASPVAMGSRVYAGSSYEHQVFFGVETEGAQGDLTGTERVLWSRSRGTPYVPSPLLYEGVLYFHNHYQGVLTRVDATDGRERPGPMRLPGIRNVYGSPVAADGRVYVTDLQGTTVVLSHSDEPEVLARNRLHDSFSASAVLAGTDLYLRGHSSLYALSEATVDPSPEPVFRLIHERLSQMRDVALFKARNSLAVEDKEREKVVLEKAKQSASAAGLDPDSVAAFYHRQIQAAKAIQNSYLAKWASSSSMEDEPVKDLVTEIRPTLIRIGDELVAALATFLEAGGCFRSEHLSLFLEAVTVEHLTEAEERQIFEAMLSINLEISPARCGPVG